MKYTNGANDAGFAVLLAADDLDSVAELRHSLQESHILRRLVLVRNGEEALAYLLGDGKYTHRVAYPFPNVVFVDCRLPMLSGLGLLCWLRSEPRFERVPVVMLSNALSQQQVESLTRLHAASCSKTSPSDKILEAITRSVRLALGSEIEAEPLQLASSAYERV